MDPDAEFNLLNTLHQSVVHDMKHTYPGWEQLSQKAIKLGTQLKATAQCLSSFIEAMQAICDHANNLKGASRDVGACVTRVCIKQRAIENRMRSWADALCDELALSLQQRVSYWKSRCSDLDKQGAKHVKKVRSRKQRPDVTAMNEQRDICTKILKEQRVQFAFFIGTLMPVLQAQISMFDEGSHLRQVVDNLDSTLKHVDTDQLVQSIVSDIAQGPDSAWKQCLTEAGQKWRSSEDGYSYAGSVRDMSTRATTPASNFSSDECVGGTLTNRGARTSQSMLNSVMDSSASSVISSSRYSSSSKPPLQRRNSEKSIGQFSMSSPNTDGSSTYLNLMGTGGNTSSNTITEMEFDQNGKSLAPISRNPSFVSNHHHTLPPPAYQQVISQRQHQQHAPLQRPQNLVYDLEKNNGYINTNSSIGATPIISNHPCETPDTASSSAFLIAEACKEIDQLGSDLENYCAMTNETNDTARFYTNSENTPTRNGMVLVNRRASTSTDYGQEMKMKRSSVSTIGNGIDSSHHPPPSQNQQQQPVRMRTSSASRPPPPTRRSSQITAATPTAPSVAEQRMNGAISNMGSRQSLDSAGIYDTSQSHLTFTSYNTNVSSFGRTNQNNPAAKFRI